MFTIIFDLDGTLVDTAPDLIDTLNFTLKQHRMPTLPYEEARRLIGGGMRAMLEGAMVVEGRSASPADINSLYGFGLMATIADRSRPFPGVEVELDRLVTAGYRLAVCTNKLQWLSRRLIDALELSDRFAAICGPDTFGVQKPDPRILRSTIARVGGEPARAIMVGDSITDIRTARTASVPIIAVHFGYTDVPITTLGPDRIISAFAELPEAIVSLVEAVSACRTQ